MRDDRDEVMKRHLRVVTIEDGVKIGDVPVADPFHTTRIEVEYGFSLWARIKILFGWRLKSKYVVQVQSDEVTQRWWFGSGDERKNVWQIEKEYEERKQQVMSTLFSATDQCSCEAKPE